MPKIGRNAPCPCGSGKKFKRCCLKKTEDAARAAAATASPPGWVLEDDDLDELSNQAVDLIQLGKLDEAEAVGRQLLERYPEVPDGLERLAAVHEARGDFAKAAKRYRQAAELIEGQDGYDPEMNQFFKEQAAKLEQKAGASAGDTANHTIQPTRGKKTTRAVYASKEPNGRNQIGQPHR